MCVFPTPTGPNRVTDSPACSQRVAGRVADPGRGELGGGGEVKPFQGDLLLEPRSLQPPLEGDGLVAGHKPLVSELRAVEYETRVTGELAWVPRCAHFSSRSAERL
jgi:hypothetical protein